MRYALPVCCGLAHIQSLQPFNAVEADLTRARVDQTYPMALVVSIEKSRAPSLAATGVNASEDSMRHGQAAYTVHQRT